MLTMAKGKRQMSATSGHYKFKKHDNIGAMDAEHDERFLEECFIDNGDLSTLVNVSNPKCIILGRTGSGKSALLLSLKRHCNQHGGLVIQLRPDDLSFNYISNSTILAHLNQLNVNLDPFFKLLWKHVFAVSVFQARFNLTDEQTQKSWLFQLLDSKETKQKRRQEETSRKKAVEYVQRWGNKFWEATDVRIKEIVSHFEEEIKSELTAGLSAGAKGSFGGSSVTADANLNGKRSASDTLSTTVSAEYVENARRVINAIQVKELTGILELVDEVISDRQKPCYILIDRLDEAWAEDGLRLRLMKALLETVSEFRQVKNAKVVLCLRIDLLERVFREMRSVPGFQEEKFGSLYLPLTWSDAALEQLLDMRVKSLVRDQYTSYQPTASDILPGKIGAAHSGNGLKFILERTWKRPRDVIEFLNICIQHSEGKAKVSKTTLFTADGEFSRSRFKSLGQEWEHLYPGLLAMTRALLANQPHSLTTSDLTEDRLWNWSESCFKPTEELTGTLGEWASDLVNNSDFDRLRQRVVGLFFKVGIVGLRLDVNQPVHWSSNTSPSISQSEIRSQTRMEIHPALWRVLGTPPS
jgi:hypothetical protein